MARENSICRELSKVQSRTWATEVEIFADSAWLQKPIYVYVPYRLEGKAWHKIQLNSVTVDEHEYAYRSEERRGGDEEMVMDIWNKTLTIAKDPPAGERLLK